MTQSIQIPTTCSHGKKKHCRYCSRYKMVILLKHGCDDLKPTMPDGRKVNPVRYSYVSKNRKGAKYNIEGMMRRYQSDVLMKFANCIQFYENPGGSLIATVRL